MTEKHPFKKGDRVRFTDYAWSQCRPQSKESSRGVVLDTPTRTTVKVRRDGLKTFCAYHIMFWQLDD